MVESEERLDSENNINIIKTIEDEQLYFSDLVKENTLGMFYKKKKKEKYL